MGLDKNSLSADGVAHLYRAALYLAQGSEKTGREFLIKASRLLDDQFGHEFDPLFFQNDVFKNDDERLFWAEKILDRYHHLKNTLD